MTEPSDPIVVEQAFPRSKQDVWNAITEHSQMVKWFFDCIPEFRPEAGFETQFNINTGERDFNHLWKITESIPGQKIVYDWRYEGFPGQGIVTFEVLDDELGSKLRVSAEGVESFPQDVPEFRRESGVAGWQYFIQGNLKDYLEGS